MKIITVVTFSDTKEFLGELAKSKFVEPVLRLTNLFRTSAHAAHIKHVHVLATVLQKIDSESCAMLELKTYVGDDWGRDLPNERAKWQEESAAVMKEIEKTGAIHKLEIRSGRYEPVYYHP